VHATPCPYRVGCGTAVVAWNDVKGIVQRFSIIELRRHQGALTLSTQCKTTAASLPPEIVRRIVDMVFREAKIEAAEVLRDEYGEEELPFTSDVRMNYFVVLL